MSFVDYTDPATIQKEWIENIAPKYFNFDTSELHRTGEFGYTNEVMATVESDTAHGVSIARREFYPTTAKYTKSLYKMAALQQICGVCMPALVHRQIGNTAFLQEGLVSAIIPIVCHKSSVVPWKYINGFAGQRSKQFAHIWVDSDYTGMSGFCLFPNFPASWLPGGGIFANHGPLDGDCFRTDIVPHQCGDFFKPAASI